MSTPSPVVPSPVTSFSALFKPLKVPNLGLVRFPEVQISDEDRTALGLKKTASNKAVLKQLAWQGYRRLKEKGWFKDTPEETVIECFKTEFATFDKTGVHDYLLLVWDYIRWAVNQGIVIGWGRGSAASSLTLCALGITRVDPIRHKLNFPRFLSEARMKPVIKDGVVWVDGKSAPDIDSDFQFGRRAEVVHYIEQRYPGRTCKISTRQELTGKMALKHALKAYADYKDEDAQAVSDLIESRFGKVQSLRDARDGGKDTPPNEAIKKWLAASEANREVYAIAMAIEGLAIAKGQHPSGVFICYYLLDGNIPTEVMKERGGAMSLVSSFDMETMALLGLKVDLLGLRTLDVIAKTAQIAGVSLDDLDVDDPVIYEYLNRPEAHYVGLFQIEDGSTKDAVIKIGPKDVEALSVAIAISRPGALAHMPTFVDYYRNGTLKSVFPAIDAVIGETGNVLVYQEQITAICHHVFGLSLIDADSVRYAVGKKKREEMAKWEPALAEGGKTRGIPPEVIKYFWDVCNASADYLFCRGHSAPYSYTTAITTLLKARYHQAFYMSALVFSRDEPNPTEAANTIISEMTRAGVPLMPPDIVRSDMDFTIEGDGIRFGLASIKGISEMTFTKLTALRGRTFESKFDLFDAAKGAALQINMLCGLIYCGCLSWEGTPRTKLALEAQTYNLLSDNQKTKVKQYGLSKGTDDIVAILKALPTTLNEKGKPLVPESQIETLRRKYRPYYDMYLANERNRDLTYLLSEKHYLGYAYTSTLAKVYGTRIVGLVTIEAVRKRGDEVAKAQAALTLAASQGDGSAPREKPAKQEPVKAVCTVDEVKHGVSRSNQSPYLRMALSDETGTINAMLYGEERLEACRSYNGKLPEEGDIVMCSGVLSKDGRLWFMDDVIVQTTGVLFRKPSDDEAAA